MTGESAAPAEMPGVEEIKELLLRFHADTASAWRHERDGIATFAAREILALFAPILAEKERTALRRETRALSQAQEWRNIAEKSEARALAAEAALEPFASYHEDSELLDNEGAPLPDEQRAGYVYLTMGDFRRAKAALAQIAAPGAAMEVRND